MKAFYKPLATQLARFFRLAPTTLIVNVHESQHARIVALKLLKHGKVYDVCMKGKLMISSPTAFVLWTTLTSTWPACPSIIIRCFFFNDMLLAFFPHNWGVSTVKYTTPLPSIGLSESDSKIYMNLSFVLKKIINSWKNTLIYKAKQFMLTIFFKKSLHTLKDNASSVQVNILNMWLSIFIFKHDKITLNWFSSTKLCNGALNLKMKSRIKKNSTFEILKVMKSMSKITF